MSDQEKTVFSQVEGLNKHVNNLNSHIRTIEDQLLRTQCDRDAARGIVNHLVSDNIQLNSNIILIDRTVANLKTQLENMSRELNNAIQCVAQRDIELAKANEQIICQVKNTKSMVEKLEKDEQQDNVVNLPATDTKKKPGRKKKTA